MSTHTVDASVVIWAIRYCLANEAYPSWDGIRLARKYVPDMDTGYLKVLHRTIATWLEAGGDHQPALVGEWVKILDMINNIIIERHGSV
jgi:hypothetical protein